MIKNPDAGDRDALFKIWQVCFGDIESYINFFLDNGYSPQNCLAFFENGSPVAMLHLRFADMFISGRSEPVMYVYAAATLPEYRGHGIMAQLIKAAVAYGDSLGCAFTFLLPANGSLYDYYGRLGFKTAFGVKKASLNRENLKEISSSNVSFSKISDYYESRLKFFSPVIQWRKTELSYAFAEWKFTGGEILEFDGGYALARKHDNRVEVKEVCGDISALSSILLSHYDCGLFSFLLPPNNQYKFETKTERYGMLISSTDKTYELVKNLNPYVNLMLD